MITRGVSFVSRLAVFFAVLFAFTACGGGGGGSSFYEGTDDDRASELSLKLYDADGNETNTVSPSAPAVVRVKVRNGGSDIVVTAQASLGTLFPATGTALTDDSGTAEFQLEAGNAKCAGTGTARATVDG